MAIKSSLVTAKSGAALKKFELQKNSKVGENLNLDPKAKTYYNSIIQNYNKIRTLFTQIANEYTSCANKSVNGEQLQATLKKIAKNCSNQGKYCNARKEDLISCFRYAKLENEIQKLIEQLNAQAK